MDGNTNVHKLRVISFGKNGSGRDYFVEQIGDTSRHLMPSKKIIHNNSKEEVHTSTARQRGDDLNNETDYRRTMNAFIKRTNHLDDTAKPNQHNRSLNVKMIQRTNAMNNPTLQYPIDEINQTALKDVIKCLPVKDTHDKSPIKNRERRKSPNAFIQNILLSEKEALVTSRQHSPSPKGARNNSPNIPVQDQTVLKPSKRNDCSKTAIYRKSATNRIFRVPKKRKVKKRGHSRIFYICNAKQTGLNNNFKYSDRIKETFKMFNRVNSSKLKIKKKQKEFINHSKRDDDINVLFSRTPKTTDSLSKQDSSKEDVFGFRKCNRFRSSVSVYQQYRSQLLRPKRAKSIQIGKTKNLYSADHIPLRVMTSRRTKSAKSVECIPGHFNVHQVNVVEFPHETNRAFRNNRVSRRRTRFETTGVDPCKLLYTSKYDCTDAGCETAPVGVESVGLDPDQQIQPCDQRCDDPFQESDLYNDRNQIMLIVKYILFGLALLVWSPCIIMVVVCWLITYPLRPNCITAQVRGKRGYLHRLPCSGKSPEPEPGFWSSFVQWIKSAEWFNRDAYKAVVSLVRKESTEDEDDECTSSCQHRLQPNPNRQYTLYHSADRGWVMKPIRFLGDEKRTEVLNVLCDPHKRQPKNQQKLISKEKKKVRIRTPADMPSDFGTVPPNKIEYRRYSKNCCRKTITSQPLPETSPQSYQHESRNYRKSKSKKTLTPHIDSQCNVKTKGNRSTYKENFYVNPNIRSARKKEPVDANRRYCDPCAKSDLYAQQKASSAKRARKSPKATEGENPCLGCIVSRNSPCVRPPCKSCRLRILNKLYPAGYKGKGKKHINIGKKCLQTKKFDTRSVGYTRYKCPSISEKIKRKNRQGNCIQRYYNSIKHEIRETEKAVWYPEFRCGQMWVQTLKKRPCFCIYKMCPSFYPTYLSCCNQIGSCCHMIMFCLSSLIWFPPIFCCYVCSQFYCKLFK